MDCKEMRPRAMRRVPTIVECATRKRTQRGVAELCYRPPPPPAHATRSLVSCPKRQHSATKAPTCQPANPPTPAPRTHPQPRSPALAV